MNINEANALTPFERELLEELRKMRGSIEELSGIIAGGFKTI